MDSLEQEFRTVRVGLLVSLEATSGRERELDRFLRGGLPLVDAEPATIAWFALQLGPSTCCRPSRRRVGEPRSWSGPSYR
jgi:hypothetical protein